MQCSQITTKGTQCKYKSYNGCNGMCKLHFNKTQNINDPSNRGYCTHQTLKGTLCKNRELTPNSKFCYRHASANNKINCSFIINKNGNNRECRNKKQKNSQFCHMHNQDNQHDEHEDEDEHEEHKNNNEEQHYCQAITINNKEERIECNKKIKNGNYCKQHQKIYKLEKPDDCIVCAEHIDIKTEMPLSCGHWIHFNCMRNWVKIKDTCPCCRTKITKNEKQIFTKQPNQFINIKNSIHATIDIIKNITNIIPQFTYKGFDKLLTTKLSILIRDNYNLFENISLLLPNHQEYMEIVPKLDKLKIIIESENYQQEINEILNNN